MHTPAPAIIAPLSRTRPRAAGSWSRLAITCLIGCLLIPRGVELRLGSIVIDPSRLMLAMFGVAALVRWLTGSVRMKLTACDCLMGVHVGLIAFSAVYHEGYGEGLERAVSMMLFTGVAYGIARVAICDEAAFGYYVRVVLIVAAISGALGVFEMFTGYSPLRHAYKLLFPNVPYVYLENKRLSLYRAQATFRADILFGLYCVTAIGLSVFLGPRMVGLKRSTLRICQALALAGIFSSLSSGPWLATALMVSCIVYDRITRGVSSRWVALVAFGVLGFGVLQMVAPNGAINFLINRLTLNPESGHVRKTMWECVLALVPDYWPLGWGWGDDWPRKVEWYVWASIDSYYAVYFVRSGIFTIVSLVAFYLIGWVRAGRLTRRGDIVSEQAKGWILATVCLALVAITVHIFGNLIYAVYFLLGAGQWFVVRGGDTRRRAPHPAGQPMPVRRRLRPPAPARAKS